MSGYPAQIIKAYADGGITRAQFRKQFNDWQKSRGINYDCKGTGGKDRLGLTYRGRHAVIKGGVIVWTCGEYRDPKKGNRRFVSDTARSIFEFRRKVDFAICRRLRGAAWS